MKYFRRVECGEPEEITWDDFVKGIQGEFFFGKNYYEHIFVILGMGKSIIGSIHMYWIEKEET